MKGLKRAAEAWIWVDAMVKLFGGIAVIVVLICAWYVLITSPQRLGL